MLPELSNFVLISMLNGHDMGVGAGSESNLSNLYQTGHLAEIKFKMICKALQ